MPATSRRRRPGTATATASPAMRLTRPSAVHRRGGQGGAAQAADRRLRAELRALPRHRGPVQPRRSHPRGGVGAPPRRLTVGRLQRRRGSSPGSADGSPRADAAGGPARGRSPAGTAHPGSTSRRAMKSRTARPCIEAIRTRSSRLGAAPLEISTSLCTTPPGVSSPRTRPGMPSRSLPSCPLRRGPTTSRSRCTAAQATPTTPSVTTDARHRLAKGSKTRSRS